MKVIKKLWALAWVAALLAVLFSASAAALPTDFSKLYVFGDSLSDTGNDFVLSGGNVPPPTRSDNGRFSNGTVWVETVADAFGINPSHFVPSLSPNATPANFLAGYSLNYAYGGSATGLQNTTPDGLLTVRGLLGQVADFTSFATAAGGVSDPAHSLYTLWSGANDYLPAGSGGFRARPPTRLPSWGMCAAAFNNFTIWARGIFSCRRLLTWGTSPSSRSTRPTGGTISRR